MPDRGSDRALYDYLRKDALLEPEMLFPGDDSFGCHISPIGGCSEEDIQIYLRYYADERERQTFPHDEGDVLPLHEPPPYDRDRLLPSHEERLFGREQ